MPFVALPYSQETINQVTGPSGEMEITVSHSPIDGGDDLNSEPSCGYGPDDLNSTPDMGHDHPGVVHAFINRTIQEHY